MSSNNTTINLESLTNNNDNKSEQPFQTYDIKKEENSKIRYIMSYYGY